MTGTFAATRALSFSSRADIVVTNPPFSLFREFVTLLNKHDKKFLLVGNQNAITYKEVFRLIMENKPGWATTTAT